MSTSLFFVARRAFASQGTLTAADKEAVRAYRRAEKIRSAVHEIESNPQLGRDVKVAKHPLQRTTTAILTNGATVRTLLPYYSFKWIRLEDDYLSQAKNQLTRPLPLRERRLQPAKYARRRRTKK
jgi:hypothetical protein